MGMGMEAMFLRCRLRYRLRSVCDRFAIRLRSACDPPTSFGSPLAQLPTWHPSTRWPSLGAPPCGSSDAVRRRRPGTSMTGAARRGPPQGRPAQAAPTRSVGRRSPTGSPGAGCSGRLPRPSTLPWRRRSPGRRTVCSGQLFVPFVIQELFL